MSSDVISWRNNGKLTTHTLTRCVLETWRRMTSGSDPQVEDLALTWKQFLEARMQIQRALQSMRNTMPGSTCSWTCLLLSHAWTSMFLKYGMEWRYHDHDTHTNIEGNMDCWSTVKGGRESMRVINPESRERCVGEMKNKNEIENGGQISLFSGATQTVLGKDKRTY